MTDRTSMSMIRASASLDAHETMGDLAFPSSRSEQTSARPGDDMNHLDTRTPSQGSHAVPGQLGEVNYPAGGLPPPMGLSTGIKGFTGITFQASLRNIQPHHQLDGVQHSGNALGGVSLNPNNVTNQDVLGGAGDASDSARRPPNIALATQGDSMAKEYRPPVGLTMPVLRPLGALGGGGILGKQQGCGADSPSGDAVQSQEARSKDDSAMAHLKAVRTRCALSTVPASVALQTFKKFSKDSKLGPNEFRGGYQETLKKCRMEPAPEYILNEVFALFDKDHNGVVDMMELCCGIALFCQGSEEEKIHAIFDCFDENGDGFISNDELWTFLTAVYKIVLTPTVVSAMKGMGVDVDSPEDLASVTVLECFKQSDTNKAGKLNVEEFKSWFYAPKSDPAFMYNIGKILHS
ncbi:unnamed protein product [Amoebophrya sp. A25]|nr:unnamed protein product [Amoebophrya sp. A25]|eukprot:GSA25T00013502001.1